MRINKREQKKVQGKNKPFKCDCKKEFTKFVGVSCYVGSFFLVLFIIRNKDVGDINNN